VPRDRAHGEGRAQGGLRVKRIHAILWINNVMIAFLL
jgi:hypothetical protein